MDWSRLRRLRNEFLNPSGLDYWQSLEDLDAYAHTFAKRLQIAWDSILEEASPLFLRNPPKRVLDWGCGPGTASVAFLSTPWGRQCEFFIWDRSPLARQYATRTLTDLGVKVREWDGNWKGYDALLLGHALGELKVKTPFYAEFSKINQTILCLEPGTPEGSNTIIDLRENLKNWTAFIPCPATKSCPLVQDSTKNWCHHFIRYPSWIHQDRDWSRFFREMGIDSRSLPISYIVLTSQAVSPLTTQRLLGRPRKAKGHLRAVFCNGNSVSDTVVSKKDPRYQILKSF